MQGSSHRPRVPQLPCYPEGPVAGVGGGSRGELVLFVRCHRQKAEMLLLLPPITIPLSRGSQLGPTVGREGGLEGGGECYEYPVDEGQGYCSTSHSAQDGPTTENDPTPNVNSAEQEKPCPRPKGSSHGAGEGNQKPVSSPV